jgi:cytochrome c
MNSKIEEEKMHPLRLQAGTSQSKSNFVYCVAILLILIPLLGILAFPPSSRAAGSGATAPTGMGDADRGKLLFERRCTGCHSLDQDKEGPRLRGVYGRKAGTVTGFSYSTSLRSSNLTWNDELLAKWLTDTESVVPDNDMSFHVPNADDRADIIRYLRVTSGR